MIVCPVCEHQQVQGFECDNCGRALKVTKAPDLPAVRLPDLEVTRLEGADAPVPQAVMPDLERTQLRAGPDLPTAPVVDLERTQATPVHVSVQRMGELEGHLAERGPATPVAPVTAGTTCRYCRNVQLEGAVCDRCGMRLPRYAPRPAAGAGPAAAGQDLEVRHSCGVRTLAGAPCSSCGVYVPVPEDAG